MKTLQNLADEGLFTKSSEDHLIKQQMMDMIIDSAQKNALGRQVVQVINLRQGSSLDFNLADRDSMAVRVMSEAGEAPLTRESYSTVRVTPKKYGGQLSITTEMIEDSNYELIERNLRQAGREMANKETSLIIESFNDTTNGFPSNADHNITSAGTELGIVDITSGMKEIEEQDFDPNVMLLHPTQVNELRQIDTFVEADKVGNRATFENGWVGKIFSLDTLITSLQSSNVAHIIDTREAGILVVRRPLTVERWNDPLRDLVNATFTQRMAASVLRPRAGVKITVS